MILNDKFRATVFLRKDKLVKITTGLTSLEYQCKCDYSSCKVFPIRKNLIDSYRWLREKINSPLTINSGYRCPQHNENVGGVDYSYHMQGSAIDIMKSGDFGKIPIRDIEKVARLAGFKFIKEYNSFIHFDVR